MMLTENYQNWSMLVEAMLVEEIWRVFWDTVTNRAWTFADEKLSVSAYSNARAWNSSFSHVGGDDVIKPLHVEQVLVLDVILVVVYW